MHEDSSFWGLALEPPIWNAVFGHMALAFLRQFCNFHRKGEKKKHTVVTAVNFNKYSLTDLDLQSLQIYSYPSLLSSGAHSLVVSVPAPVNPSFAFWPHLHLDHIQCASCPRFLGSQSRLTYCLQRQQVSKSQTLSASLKCCQTQNNIQRFTEREL